ncbi:MAG: hypothetical protein QOI79_3857 [Mycobacterium sp.]|jgi:hypothetical protein|nr:hypothetical protein [Mycobacterium sp.]
MAALRQKPTAETDCVCSGTGEPAVTETAIVDKPAEQADDHGHGHHHGHAH